MKDPQRFQHATTAIDAYAYLPLWNEPKTSGTSDAGACGSDHLTKSEIEAPLQQTDIHLLAA